MLKIGLTGGIGSGKSTVSKMFEDNGIHIIDADSIAREVLNIYLCINENIKRTFGERFFNEKGELNRRELGNFIFADKKRIKELENIIMPYIKKEIFSRFHELEKLGADICILDAPTLIEQDIYKFMDKNILVWVDEKTQIERVKKRDNMCEREVLNRINSQMSLEDKKKYVDFLIDNSKDLLNTKEQVNKILIFLRGMRIK